MTPSLIRGGPPDIGESYRLFCHRIARNSVAGKLYGFRPQMNRCIRLPFRASHAELNKLETLASSSCRTHQHREVRRPGAPREPLGASTGREGLLPPPCRGSPLLFRRHRRHPPRDLHPHKNSLEDFLLRNRLPFRSNSLSSSTPNSGNTWKASLNDIPTPQPGRTADEDLASREDPYNVSQASRIYILPTDDRGNCCVAYGVVNCIHARLAGSSDDGLYLAATAPSIPLCRLFHLWRSRVRHAGRQARADGGGNPFGAEFDSWPTWCPSAWRRRSSCSSDPLPSQASLVQDIGASSVLYLLLRPCAWPVST